MNYLYEEDISVYDPMSGYTSQPTVISEDQEKLQARAASVLDLMKHPGWKLLKEYLDDCVELHTKDLINSTEMDQICRLQAAIKVSKSIESFLNSVVWEAQLPMDNQETGPNQGEDE